MIENKFIHYSTVAAFENDRQQGNIANTSIAFVEDPTGIRKIYTHGKEYVCTDYSQQIRYINDRIDAIIAGGGGGTVESNAEWDHPTDELRIPIGASMPYTTPKVVQLSSDEIVKYYSENPNVFEINENSGDIIRIGSSVGNARVRAVVKNTAINKDVKNLYYTVYIIEDAITQILWSGYGIGNKNLTTGQNTSFTKGTVVAAYASGKTETLSSGVTYTATGGTFSQDYSTYTAPNSAGTYTIKAKVGNLTSQQSISVTVTKPIIPAYVGGGATFEDAIKEANKRTDYGTGSKTYNAHADAGEYYWFIFPEGTTIGGITAQGFTVPFVNAGIQSHSDVRYNAYYNTDQRSVSTDDTFTVTFN